MPRKVTDQPQDVSLAAAPDNQPLVHVAMATFNGREWIGAQVASILDQEGVSVRLVVSDDGSNDGTFEWLQALAARDSRVRVLPPRTGERGVGANFLHAFSALQVQPGQYAAFSDQDDLWRPGKLVKQIDLLGEGAGGVSSNVVAFQVEDGDVVNKTLIRKDQAQVDWDYVFEAPGPGSTFLLSYEAWEVVCQAVAAGYSEGIALHDWFAYAVVRAAGMRWIIGAEPQVAYRQHRGNVLGAHRGLAAMKSRFTDLRSGHYREQFLLTARAAFQVGSDAGREQDWQGELTQLQDLLADRSLKARWRLFRQRRNYRRDPREALALLGACLLGVW